MASNHPCRGGGYLHRLGTTAKVEARRAVVTLPIAPIEQRDRVYRLLLDQWPLTPEARQHLLGVRGLPVDVVDGRFGSVPEFGLEHRFDRLEVVRSIERQGVTVAGVPGFYRERANRAIVPTSVGIAVPTLDQFGRIQALTIRRWNLDPDEARYVALSSGRWQQGASSGTPVAVWRSALASRGVVVTEGALKGCITAYRMNVCVLAVSGVTNWRGVLPLLEKAPSDLPVIVAYDRDSATKLEVWRAREELCRVLIRDGHRVLLATWDGTKAKGVDDALLGGIAVDLEAWRPSLAPSIRPVQFTSLTAPTRPMAGPLAEITR